jgi:hypothetical protein
MRAADRSQGCATDPIRIAEASITQSVIAAREGDLEHTVALGQQALTRVGIDICSVGLLCVDWVPPHDPWDDLLAFIFDGGALSDQHITGLTDADKELRAVEFCPVSEAARRLPPRIGRWLTAAVQALAEDHVQYLQDGTHYKVLIQHGGRIQVRSTPGSRSRLKIDMTLNGQIFNGMWAEESDPNGYYRGAVYYGAIHMIGDPPGQAIEGKWVGFGKCGENNDGLWTLKRLTGQATPDDITRYSKPTDQDDT